jgi:hypothetical protein
MLRSPKMTASRRASLPRSAFGLDGSRRYPMDTVGRAIAAKGRATQMEERGKLSPSSARKIRRKADRRLQAGKRR